MRRDVIVVDLCKWRYLNLVTVVITVLIYVYIISYLLPVQRYDDNCYNVAIPYLHASIVLCDSYKDTTMASSW